MDVRVGESVRLDFPAHFGRDPGGVQHKHQPLAGLLPVVRLRNLLEVAEAHYRQASGEWLVLVLDPAKITPEVRWEVQANALAYPHIHGALNLDSVTEVRPFPRDSEGRFLPFS